MARTKITRVVRLGELVAARGNLGPAHSHATSEQMRVAQDTVIAPTSYMRQLKGCVICIEDRLDANGFRMLAARLAGGALSLALMYNFYRFLVQGAERPEARFSDDLLDLKALGFYLVLHDHCGALDLTAEGMVQRELANVNAQGYKLLASLGGYDVPMSIRRKIAEWTRTLPSDYIDVSPREALKMRLVDEVEAIVGDHNAVIAGVSLVDDESFTAGPELGEQTNGLRAFAFDPWIAVREGHRIAVSLEHAEAAADVALVFTAQVLTMLGGPDLVVAIHE